MRLPLAAALLALGSCEPIVGQPASSAPVNSCEISACDLYRQPEDPSRARPICAKTMRCEVASSPPYKYVLAVAVPYTSRFAPGRTYLLRSQDLKTDDRRCQRDPCIILPLLVEVRGEYAVSADAASTLGRPVGQGSPALPARVAFYPEIAVDDGAKGAPVDASAVGLPAPPMFAELLSGDVSGAPGSRAIYRAFVPVGSYQRMANPASPFDEPFPPLIGSLLVRDTPPFFTDAFVVGVAPTELDDPSGASRTATVSRREGLEGFRVFLRDRATERRISPLRVLSGTERRARLDTVGQSGPQGPALRDGVDIVVAPPEGWLGVPTLVDRILAGALVRLEYPPLPPPSAVSGQVIADLPVASRLVFVSTEIDRVGGPPVPLLQYRATVDTDGEGRFSTLLAAGRYEVFIEPTGGAGRLGKTRLRFEAAKSDPNVRLSPQFKARVTGRLRLSDGRPLSGAEVVASPAAARRPELPPWARPRSARTVSGLDGGFSFYLDEGEFDLTVMPEPGTGFPWLVSPGRPIGPTESTIDELVVPVPTRTSLDLKDPGGQPIARAVVRAYTLAAGTTTFVEVGREITDERGHFDMLLGPQPR